MSKKKLFDDESDEEVALETENEYAKKYDTWRGKEELHKLEQKYGSEGENSESDSEDESDEPLEVSEEMEAQFLKTLALLKAKDPKIYNPDFKCFDEETEQKENDKKPKAKSITFEDSDDDDDDGNIFTIEKKAEIVADNDDQAKQDTNKGFEEGKIKEYLTGQVEHIEPDTEAALAPLRALWAKPANEDEAFLRDYILNKRYLEEGAIEAGDRLRDDEDLEADERRVEEQGQFERAYNFRFEEPDDEYLKRYPRTMNSIRPKDDRRSRKRTEIRSRKEEEKQRKMEEIARMKALKLQEIQQKIQKIKEVTGNQELAFQEEDIVGDFDPEQHDRRMRALFDAEFYSGQDCEKPEFPDLDEELEIENWDKFDPELERATSQQYEGPHCEDDDFNMDADFDPTQPKRSLLQTIQETLGKKRRNRKRKSKLAQALTVDKPKFVPTIDKTYDQYMEEYYKMDCEDVIGGDLPTRFKYREVVPNDYGLSVEEILLADDKELTQWVPLKRIVRHRPSQVEKGEVATYRQKAADVTLKKKILPSLFKDLPDEPEIVVPVEEASKKKKRKKNKDRDESIRGPEETGENEQSHLENINHDGVAGGSSEVNTKRKKKKQGNNKSAEVIEDIENLVTSPKKKQQKDHKNIAEVVKEDSPTKKKKDKTRIIEKSKEINNAIERVEEVIKEDQRKHRKVVVNEEMPREISKKENKRRKSSISDGFIVEQVENNEPSPNSVGVNINKQKGNLKRKLDTNTNHILKKKMKKNRNFDSQKARGKNFQSKFKQKDKASGKESENPLSKLSDERLKAYGLNPKKYRSFLKYKKY